MNFDTSDNYFESIANAKLVISEMAGSVVLEALMIGKPIIVLHHFDAICTEKIAKAQDVEDLVRVGIIAGSSEKLADTVNHIHCNVEAWWNEPERQNVVKRIREDYCYFPEDAETIWVEKIASFCRGS